MKATFFITNFLVDPHDKIKFHSFSCDTKIKKQSIKLFNWNSFLSILKDNNIKKLNLIFKEFNRNIVNNLKTFLLEHQNQIDIKINEYIEKNDCIFPTELPDVKDELHLRFVYDESSIFDSEYIFDKLKPLSLLNESKPDSTIIYFEKNKTNNHPLQSIDNLCLVKSPRYPNTTTTDKIIKLTKKNVNNENFYEVIDALIDNDSILSEIYLNKDNTYHVQSFNIVYGKNLDVIHISHQGKKFSINLIDSTFKINNFDIKLGRIFENKIVIGQEPEYFNISENQEKKIETILNEFFRVIKTKHR